jgi:hypothetical protein
MKRGLLTRCTLLALVAACGTSSMLESSQSDQLQPPKDAIAKTSEKGPVKAVVTVWPAKPNLGESIYLRLDVDAPAGISVDAPFQEAGDQRLGRFKVVGFVRDTHRKPDGSQHQEQTYTLEALSSGKHRIPPLRLEMLDTRDAAKQSTTDEILTDEVPLDVAPIPTDAIAKELKPATGTLDPDVGGTPWLVILLLGSAGAVAISGSLLLLRAARSRRSVAAKKSAYEDAVAKLRALESRGAPDAEQADAWFVELSAIVRSYLEHRYDIRAPELTTEEFLQAASRSPELSRAHSTQLSQFLERCDRVKFAGYRPESDESIATLAAARAFVEETRLREDAIKGAA